MRVRPAASGQQLRRIEAAQKLGIDRNTITSYVLCHQPKFVDWRARGAKPYAMGVLADPLFVQACAVLNQIIDIG